jgi:hypothetical protein
MIRISGNGNTSSEIPVDFAAAHLYFQDTVRFLDKIEAVDKVKTLSRPNTYLLTHHAVGGLNYKVVLATCMGVEWHETGLKLVPLDFDHEKIACDYPVVKGFSDGSLDLLDRGDRTGVDFRFKMDIEIPIAGALKFLPRPVVQATADGIMAFEVNRTVRNLFSAVLKDFNGAVTGSLAH